MSDRCTGLAHRLENGSVITALDPNSGSFPSNMGCGGGQYLFPYTAPVQKYEWKSGPLPLFHPDMAHPFGKGVSIVQLKRCVEQVEDGGEPLCAPVSEGCT